MNFIARIADRENRLIPIVLQCAVVTASAVGFSYLPNGNILFFTLWPASIGWFLNRNEVHRLILIPAWIMASLLIAGSLY
jgi:hypothetical protein